MMGGLGNQLFIVAAAFHMKNLVSTTLIFQRGPGSPERPTQWDKFFADCPLVLETLVSVMPEATWITYGNTRFSSDYEDRSGLIEENKQNGISIINEGYFQNLRYLPSRSHVRELFNISAKQDRMRKIISGFDPSTTCAIHFRLGDYKYLSNVFRLLDDEYYSKALSVILKTNPNLKTLLIFNEPGDQQIVEERMKSLSTRMGCEVRYMSQYYMRDWEEMIVMSLCSAIIMANSTFSWWAAYLASDPDVTVAYPSFWHRDQGVPPEESLALPGWIKC